MKVRQWTGEPLSEPGAYRGVPSSVYHGANLCDGPSVSRSGLWKIFQKSAAHYFKDSPYNPRAKKYEESEALVLGRAAHHKLLGERSFLTYFAIRPDHWDSWRTDASKAWRKAQQDEGKSVLEPKHLEQIAGMWRGLSSEPIIRMGALNGLVEHTLIAKDPDTGVWLKIRPDVIPNDSGDYSDLKTAIDITDEGIEKSIGRDGLFMQGGLTAYVCSLLGLPFNSFNLAVIEKDEPFCCQVKALKPADIDLGWNASKAAVYEFKKCYDRGIWPGPGREATDAAYVEMRPFDRKRFEDRIKLMETSR